MRTGLLFLIVAGTAAAQAPGDPLTLIRVVRRHIGPRDPMAAYRNARPPVEVTGLRSITGSAQAWLVEAHGSFATLESTDGALAQVWSGGDAEDELVAPSLSMIGLYREGLSYRPDEAIKLMPSARFMQVSVYRNRPGFDVDFGELIRMRKAALDRVNSDRPELGYQVISGAQTGTYIFMAPLVSLRTLDQSLARWWHIDGLAGGPRGAGRQIAAEGDITREHLLFRVEPRWKWTPEERPQ